MCFVKSQKPFCTIADIAKLLSISYNTAAVVFRDLPQVKIGRRLRVRRTDVERLIKGQDAA